MQPEDRDIAFLWDILEAAKDIHDFVRKTTLKEFSSDKKTRYAIERQLLVIGEAAKRVSESYKQKPQRNSLEEHGGIEEYPCS